MFYSLYVLGNYLLLSSNIQRDDVVDYNLVDKHKVMQVLHYHISLNMFYNTILVYPMASVNLTDENIKNLCYLLWIFETRIAIMIITNHTTSASQL